MHILIAIILSFGKIGFIALGGGNSMLKLLEYEAVTYRHWVGQEEFIHMLSSSFLFPGLTGVKLAALIGYRAAGYTGLTLAIISLSLPGLILTLIGYRWLSTHNTPLTKKIMIGVQYGALALLAATSYSLGKDIITTNYSLPIILACLFFFIALAFFQTSPFWGFLVFIAICVLLGGN